MTLAAFGFLHMTIADLLDIFLMALVIYVIFRWIRGSSAMSIFLVVVLFTMSAVLCPVRDNIIVFSISSAVIFGIYPALLKYSAVIFSLPSLIPQNISLIYGVIASIYFCR